MHLEENHIKLFRRSFIQMGYTHIHDPCKSTCEEKVKQLGIRCFQEIQFHPQEYGCKRNIVGKSRKKTVNHLISSAFLEPLIGGIRLHSKSPYNKGIFSILHITTVHIKCLHQHTVVHHGNTMIKRIKNILILPTLILEC